MSPDWCPFLVVIEPDEDAGWGCILMLAKHTGDVVSESERVLLDPTNAWTRQVAKHLALGDPRVEHEILARIDEERQIALSFLVVSP